MIDAERFTPGNGWILLLKCKNDHVRSEDGDVLVELTEKSLDNTIWLEVISVGPKCKVFGKDAVGGFVMGTNRLRNGFLNMKRLIGDGYWLAREDVLPPFVVEMP